MRIFDTGNICKAHDNGSDFGGSVGKSTKGIAGGTSGISTAVSPNWLAVLNADNYEFIRQQLQSAEAREAIAALENKYRMDFEQFRERYLIPAAADLYENKLVAMDWEALVQVQKEADMKIEMLQHERFAQSLLICH